MEETKDLLPEEQPVEEITEEITADPEPAEDPVEDNALQIDASEEGSEEAEEEQSSMPANAGMFSLIRILAGGYLIYLAYNMLKGLPDYLTEGWGKEAILIVVASVVFVGFGGYILIKYLRMYFKYSKQFKK